MVKYGSRGKAFAAYSTLQFNVVLNRYFMLQVTCCIPTYYEYEGTDNDNGYYISEHRAAP